MTEPPIDFSSLDPTRDRERWEARIAETVEQVEHVRGLDLSALDPYAGDDGEAKRQDVVRKILTASAPPPVVRLAPRALTLAACLAAAAWLLAWFAPAATVPDADVDPALALMSWAESGGPLTDDQLALLTGSASHER